MKIILILILFLYYLQTIKSIKQWGSVSIIDEEYNFTYENIKNTSADSWGYIEINEETGWKTLEIWVNPNISPIEGKRGSYAAGVLEAGLTQKYIYELWINIKQMWFPQPNSTISPLVVKFLSTQDTWTRGNIQEFEATDDYWRNVGYVLYQSDGILNGYNYFVNNESEKLEDWMLQVLLYMPDMMDLSIACGLDNHEDFSNDFFTDSKFEYNNIKFEDLFNSHCSALVKFLKDSNEIYFAHTTWYIYIAEIRFMKNYHIKFNGDTSIYSDSVVMSSYPGTICSADDYYLTSYGLGILETSFSIFNQTLYKKVTPYSLLSWMRGVLANRMAYDGVSWAEFYLKSFSGTQNNQWVILDFNKFDLFKESKLNDLIDGTLYIVETEPGYFYYQDVTEFLRNYSYWPSYNIPFSKKIYNETGYEARKEKYGPEQYSYENCSRADIFRRNQTMIKTIEDMKEMMRYNDYLNDPLSHGDPSLAIASRADITENFPTGAVDSKVTSFQLFQNQMSSWIINSPTYVDLPPFTFDNPVFSSWIHLDIPDTIKFPWVLFQFNDSQ
eukprot:Anaeramoba_ignava/a348577_30.p1 GENE.a348577_30~~a348577_30.p1  ORF type:complete len:555 (-),score=170.36 a348577_30:1164-2828(-)